MTTPELITIKDITTLTGYNKSAVSNWTSRHRSFPAPVGTGKPMRFNREEVMAWLKQNRPGLQLGTDTSPLATALRALKAEHDTVNGAALTALRLLTVAANRPLRADSPTEPSTWEGLCNDVKFRPSISRFMPEPSGNLSPSEAELYGEITARLIEKDGEDTSTVVHGELADEIMGTLLTGLSPSAAKTADAAVSTPARILSAAAQVGVSREVYVYSPVCGIGDELLDLMHDAQDLSTIQAFDSDETAAAIAALRLDLAGRSAEVAAHNVLIDDTEPDYTADIAIADLSSRRPPAAFARTDNRWPEDWELRGDHVAAAAIILDIISHLADTGRGYVVTSTALLTDDELEAFRIRLVAHGHLEAIIELPASNAALWILRPHSASDAVVLIDAKNDTLIDRHLGDWITQIRGGMPVNARHKTITTADMHTRASTLDTYTHLHPEPTRHQAVEDWAGAARTLKELISPLRAVLSEDTTVEYVAPTGEIVRPLDIDDRPDFERAPTVTVRALIREGVVRIVNCHTTRPHAISSERMREVIVLPYQDPDNLDARSSTVMRSVPEDYDTATTGDVVVPLHSRHDASLAPFDDFAVSSAARVLRVTDPARLDATYLMHCINAGWNTESVSGSLIPRRSMKEMRVPLITLAAQERFVDYLETLERGAVYATEVAESMRLLQRATLTAIRYQT